MDRGAFEGERDVALGTTNVDYSWELYEHFQLLRSYRETRFLVDPSGFEVATEGQGDSYREEKIDLLDRLGYASSKAEEGGREPASKPGWQQIPSAAPADKPLR